MNKLRGVILPKKWLEFDEIKDKVAYPTSQNKIEQLEKYIEVREQEIEELQDRIDKAIDFLESMDYCGQEDYFCDKTTVDEDPNGNNNSYYDSAEKLYKILKGDNK